MSDPITHSVTHQKRIISFVRLIIKIIRFCQTVIKGLTKLISKPITFFKHGDYRLSTVFKKLFKYESNFYNKINQIRYLSQSAMLEESAAPHMARVTLIFTSFIVIIAIMWAGFTEVEEMAATEGEVIPSGYVQTMQHLEGGIIAKINVTEGQVVSKGYKLLEFDGTVAKRDLAALKLRKLALEYKVRQLKALINNIPLDFGKMEGSTSERELEQLNNFNSMLEANENDRQVIEQELEQKKQQLSIMEQQKATLQANLKIVEEERELKQQLMSKGHLSRFQFLQVQKQYNEIYGQCQEVESEIIKAHNAISEYQERFEAFGTRIINDAYTQLNEVITNIAQVDENILKARDQVARLELKSPVYGIIKGLKVKNIGAVVEAGATIVEVVPLEGGVVVETKINPPDMGHIKVKQRVKIKVSSYDFSRYGTVEGRVETISATTFTSNDGRSKYYLARISLAQDYVGRDSQQNPILPGMIVQADVITGHRSILKYLLKPVYSAVDTAFTER